MKRRCELWTTLLSKLWSASNEVVCARVHFAMLSASASFFALRCLKRRINKRTCAPAAMCAATVCGVIRKKHDPATHYGWCTLAARAAIYMRERPLARPFPANNCADHIEGGTCFEFQLPNTLPLALHLRIWRRRWRPFWGKNKRPEIWTVKKIERLNSAPEWELMTQPPAFKTPPVSTRTFHALSSPAAFRHARHDSAECHSRKDQGEKYFTALDGRGKDG